MAMSSGYWKRCTTAFPSGNLDAWILKPRVVRPIDQTHSSPPTHQQLQLIPSEEAADTGCVVCHSHVGEGIVREVKDM